jgi:hypothetical protein
MAFTETHFASYQAVQMDAGKVQVIAVTSVGPRILGLMTPDGKNALVELPEATLPCPGSGLFRLRGGHRFWAAPEDPRVTYRPDDEAVGIEELPDGVVLTAPEDPLAGTQRTMTIEVTGPERISIEHKLTNISAEPQRLAPWAITMLPPGGRAWMPSIEGPFDPGGYQAQRNIVFWSYSRCDDPRLGLDDCIIQIRTDKIDKVANKTPFKVGTSLRRGWLAYWREGVLLVKRATHHEGQPYADMGASGQVYSHADFAELETLGHLVDLDPGDSTSHTEEWEIHLVDEAEAERMVAAGELDR